MKASMSGHGMVGQMAEWKVAMMENLMVELKVV
jgi:hypothetical protein